MITIRLLAALAIVYGCIQTESTARPTTQPPSVALRTALSHVAVVELLAVNEQNASTQATFKPLRVLHNTETASEIRLAVAPAATAMLVPGQHYIIAYQKQRRVGKGEPRRYAPFPGGPVLLTEQGANPALFPYHEQLERSLTADPVAAVADPAPLIAEIFAGLALPELALKRFYLRELFNWTALHEHLSDAHIQHLREVFAAPWLDAEMLVAFYEPRLALQQKLGLERLTERALTTLAGSPVQLDLLSAQPNLLLEMLRFIGDQQLAQPELLVLSRWLYSNHHLVAEKALLLIAAINPEAAAEQARLALRSVALRTEVRRILTQYLRNTDMSPAP